MPEFVYKEVSVPLWLVYIFLVMCISVLVYIVVDEIIDTLNHRKDKNKVGRGPFM